MCGIAGATGIAAERRTEAMLPRLRHRGPDDSGLHADSGGRVALGATRLSIIDVDGGHQPLTNEDGTVVCVLNGEIYNFRQLRRRLESRGHRFRTRADTEVLVHLYEEYGSALVHALDGMYAFALWDARREVMVLARDRFGEKPLFLREAGDGSLTFASELTALRAGCDGAGHALDPVSVDLFFSFGYIPGPRTIYTGIEHLPPGIVAEWRPGSGLRRSRYWSPPVAAGAAGADGRGLVEEMASLVQRAVESRMVADVPVGVFLSGGVDSSLIAAHAARATGRGLLTFSVDYDVGSVSETEPARSVATAIGSEHHAFTLTTADVEHAAPGLLGDLDQPLADPAFIALSMLSGYAREHVKVALGGEGADELFGGYPRYRWLSHLPQNGGKATLASVLERAPEGLSRVARLSGSLSAPTPAAAHVQWVAGTRLDRRAALLGPRLADRRHLHPAAVIGAQAPLAGQTRAGFLMRMDALTWLPDDVLVKADRASMLASLEARSPFLSRDLAEFAASVPAGVHLSGGGKHLVRLALRRALPTMPSKRRKVAFRVPVAEWLRGPLRSHLARQLGESWVYEDGWFDRREAGALVREHLSGEANHATTLWPLFALGCWSPS
jgi:asparagine synthase (glutamine-hydrolysing)